MTPPQSGLSARALAGRLAKVILERPLANTLYPKGKQKITGIPYEPWHFRYVGESVANGVRRTSTKTLEQYLRID